jgi:hypothetical protein
MEGFCENCGVHRPVGRVGAEAMQQGDVRAATGFKIMKFLAEHFNLLDAGACAQMTDAVTMLSTMSFCIFPPQVSYHER